MTSESRAYAPGTPIWVDLGSPDPAASGNFYGQLFGWETQDLGPESGNYTFFRDGGKVVAAVGGLMNPQQPTAWSTYVKTNNADESARKVTEAGGQVLVPPFAVMDQGTMAVFMDPAGAAFSVWQPAKMSGAEKFNEPVSVTWNELEFRDGQAAKGFYPRVFGWGVHTNQMPEGGEYIEWQVDGRSIAGGMPMGPNMPPQVPPHWLVYFSVANADNMVSRIKELGGQIMSGPHDIPQGRFAVATDPQGATFGIMQNA